MIGKWRKNKAQGTSKLGKETRPEQMKEMIERRYH